MRQTNRFCFLNVIKLTANSNFPIAAAKIASSTVTVMNVGPLISLGVKSCGFSTHTYSVLNCMKAQGMLGNILWTCFSNIVSVFVLL